jgi:hypothetical protein
MLQVLMQLAERRNAQPLPELKNTFGLRLPPEEDCLLGANYQLVRGPAPTAPAESMDIDSRFAVALLQRAKLMLPKRAFVSCGHM